MVLNDEQNELFFDVMDSLMYFVNERFRVVEDFSLDYASPLDDVKSSLVAHTLWENVAIIDDFVRENPYGLPKRGLDVALSWKYALPGFYTLVRYQSGRALLMSDAGVFSVCGVTYELEGEIGPAPAYVETVLIPFEGLIVYDGFLQAYDTDKATSDAQRIQDEFENRCAKGIASTEDEFVRQARAYLDARRDREFDEMLESLSRASDQEEELPKGFHRGALAGLTAEERQRAVEQWYVKNAPSMTVAAREFDKRVRRREPVTSLAGCLSLMTKAQLQAVADVLGMGGLSRLKKPEMVDELAAELPNAPMALEVRLTMAGERTCGLVRKLAGGDPVTFGADEREAYSWAWPLEPYVFLFKGKDGYTFLVPDELKGVVAGIDFDAIDRMRRQQGQAVNCAASCVVLCGVVSIDDAYDQYRSLVSDVLSREAFGQLMEFVAMTAESNFDIWTYLPHDYLVHYTLTPDYVAEEYANARRGSFGELMRNKETGEVAMVPNEHMMGRLRADLASEIEWIEQYKRELVESQGNLTMKPLSRTILENDMIGELLDDENVARLRAFLDARVPDGENDYTYVDWVVESVVMSIIESGSIQEVFAYMMDLGLDRCSQDEDRLPLLLTNVYNAMPSWENNGWSPQELYEQLTGRRMFYNDDGTMMKVGADDPCPCGSGKKYRECCGK